MRRAVSAEGQDLGLSRKIIPSDRSSQTVQDGLNQNLIVTDEVSDTVAGSVALDVHVLAEVCHCNLMQYGRLTLIRAQGSFMSPDMVTPLLLTPPLFLIVTLSDASLLGVVLLQERQPLVE